MLTQLYIMLRQLAIDVGHEAMILAIVVLVCGEELAKPYIVFRICCMALTCVGRIYAKSRHRRADESPRACLRFTWPCEEAAQRSARFQGQ